MFYPHAYSPFAYVGSKRLLRGELADLGDTDLEHPVLAHLMTELVVDERRAGWQFREPFLGGANVALKFLGRFPRPAWLNDFDPGTAAFWNAVIKCPKQLMERIQKDKPTQKRWDELRAELAAVYKKHEKKKVNPLTMKRAELVNLAFTKYAVTLWSHAGVGDYYSVKALKHRSADDPQKSTMFQRIESAHATLTDPELKLHQGGVTCLDYGEVVDAPGDNFVYCDPPYSMAEPGSYYAFNFSVEQHRDLAGRLLRRKHWALSYDLSKDVLEYYRIKLVPHGKFFCDIVKTGTSMVATGGRIRDELFLHDD